MKEQEEGYLMKKLVFEKPQQVGGKMNMVPKILEKFQQVMDKTYRVKMLEKFQLVVDKINRL